ncbi:HK97 family phage prohead protease [Methylobacterium sp. JK268]
MAGDNLVSVDEFLSARKAFVKGAGTLMKATRAPSSWNSAARTARFVMSAEVEDRDRDIVVQAGLDVDSFMQNPVAPFSHASYDFPVGTWSDVEKLLTGRPKRTEGTLTLVEGDEVADRLATHIAAGSIRACSIGFMPKTIQRRKLPEDADSYAWLGYLILEAELLECSPCSIPANPSALAKSAAKGDVLAREIIEQVLDEWTVENGLVVPRTVFERAHAAATRDRRSLLVTRIAEKVAAALPGAMGEPDGDEGETEAVTGIDVEIPLNITVNITQSGTTGDAVATTGAEDEDDETDDAAAATVGQTRSMIRRALDRLMGKAQAPVPPAAPADPPGPQGRAERLDEAQKVYDGLKLAQRRHEAMQRFAAAKSRIGKAA